MTPHNRLIINNDPQNMSHLTSQQQIAIQLYQQEIEELKAQNFKSSNSSFVPYHLSKRPPQTALELFTNKNFNSFKNKYPHQATTELHALIRSKWHNQLSDEERIAYEGQVKEMQRDYHQGVEDRIARINELKRNIHQIKYPFMVNNQSSVQGTEDQAADRCY